MGRRDVVVLGAVFVFVATGCAGPGAPPPSPAPASSRVPDVTPSATPTPTPTLERIELAPPSAGFGPAWSEVLTIPYGDAPERLGTSPGGDGEGVMWGPSYGTQLPDGTWWFVDSAKLRLAHFAETGAYLGELRLPREYLADGRYLQWARPLALADGTLVLQSTSADRPGLLLLSPAGALSRTPLHQWWGVQTTDGTYLYGFDDTFVPIRIDPRTGATTPVPALATQGVPAVRLTLEPGRLLVDLGAGESSLPVAASGRDDAQVHLALAAAGGADGVLNVLVSGMVEDTPGIIEDVQGLLRIDAAGRGILDDLPLLTSDADPGDGLRLGVRWGDARPWLMLIQPDAVRVFRRAV